MSPSLTNFPFEAWKKKTIKNSFFVQIAQLESKSVLYIAGHFIYLCRQKMIPARKEALT